MASATWSPIATTDNVHVGDTDKELEVTDDVIDLLALGFDLAPTRVMLSLWPQELKNQRKMKLHCNRMARFRNRRKVEREWMLEEHRRLEQELETRIRALRQADNSSGSETQAELQRRMQRLVLEREFLRDEGVALREKIAAFEKYVLVIQNASLKFESQPTTNQFASTSITSSKNVTARRVSPSRWQAVEEQAGWLVHFPGGDPSFFFQPFSQLEFDAALKPHLAASTMQDLKCAGNFFGWEVYHAPLIKRQASNLLIGRTQYCKRLQCSIKVIRDTMRKEDGTNEWPLLPSSRNLGLTEEINVLTLQQLGQDSCVIVRSLPGEINYRYLGLVQREVWAEDDGKRMLKYSLVITDSEANARSQDADPATQQNVRWIKDGGLLLTLTEVDGGNVDVTFEHWAICENEQRAQSKFVTFGSVITRWEQLVLPSKPLTF